ncbi:uncharacterized protein BDR25DRAFT_342098 [Lindgomyces ingoldianus]|uniref:Uncharacterized protein n=1 Tax=Lindgomyces ingoldianus TaxID=673940 RepID=A0ACB6QYL5_9PLEO|nr:uncharacterized protein BDR25DRAFT_342098 [Lindgomyces ingoldianus]KAF2472079.1 hypothetical protein BDR25DRAFT_342098 [Lindgomyces ingoldianus]
MESTTGKWERAKALALDTWPKTVFTNFLYLEFFGRRSKLSPYEFLKRTAEEVKADASLYKTLLDAVEEASDEDLEKMWREGWGTCSAWAILLSSRLSESLQGINFASDGTHRTAYTDDSILFNSSARNALQLEDRKPVR